MAKQKLIVGPIKGYKGTDENMRCNGFHFKLGENILNNKDDLVLCENGFHFCQQPSGPHAYGSYARMWEIRAYDVLESDFEPGADYKQVCRKIVFLREVNKLPSYRNTADRNTGYGNAGDRNTGYGNTGHGNTGHMNTGDRNTGYGNAGDRNTGDRNTGHRNTGDGNAGYWNTGDWNTGHRNTGDRNTGYRNTGHRNTGYGNAGHRNTGDGNTGDGNTGYGNATNFCSGCFCLKEQPVMFFDLPTKVTLEDIDWDLVAELSKKLQSKNNFDYLPFLSLPNATKTRIKNLHKRHLELISKGDK